MPDYSNTNTKNELIRLQNRFLKPIGILLLKFTYEIKHIIIIHKLYNPIKKYAQKIFVTLTSVGKLSNRDRSGTCHYF